MLCYLLSVGFCFMTSCGPMGLFFALRAPAGSTVAWKRSRFLQHLRELLIRDLHRFTALWAVVVVLRSLDGVPKQPRLKPRQHVTGQQRLHRDVIDSGVTVMAGALKWMSGGAAGDGREVAPPTVVTKPMTAVGQCSGFVVWKNINFSYKILSSRNAKKISNNVV